MRRFLAVLALAVCLVAVASALAISAKGSAHL
jgi:hypothetical protein